MTLDEANMTIDYLKEMQEGYIEGEEYERHPLPEWYALDKAIEAIEQTKWIPVSERLPEKSGLYLVTNRANEIEVFSFTGHDMARIFWNKYAKAWIPLPEPYEPTDSEKE